MRSCGPSRAAETGRGVWLLAAAVLFAALAGAYLKLEGAEVARFLRLSDWTVNDLARRGEIPSIKMGKSRRFRRDDLRAYLRERTAQR